MSLNNLNVAVSGSGGFVGSHLVCRLNELGAKVIEIDHRKGLDIQNFEQINTIGTFDILIHLAAKTFVPESYENPREFYFTNVVGTLNALELCRLRKARMIYASSYIYGVPQYLPIDESHPVAGFNPYSGSKIASEQLCERYHHDHGLNINILRIFNIYGPGQNSKFLIPSIIEQAQRGKIILKDATPKRDFVYIDDAVEAYIKSIQHDSNSLDIFNIGSGKSFSVKEIVAEVLQHFTEDIQVVFTGEERVNEVPDTIANITKAQELLGWIPEFSLSEGIRNCVAAAKNR